MERKFRQVDERVVEFSAKVEQKKQFIQVLLWKLEQCAKYLKHD